MERFKELMLMVKKKLFSIMESKERSGQMDIPLFTLPTMILNRPFLMELWSITSLKLKQHKPPCLMAEISIVLQIIRLNSITKMELKTFSSLMVPKSSSLSVEKKKPYSLMALSKESTPKKLKPLITQMDKRMLSILMDWKLEPTLMAELRNIILMELLKNLEDQALK